MDRKSALLITLVLCSVVTSCVNVTTARHSASMTEVSDSQTVKNSNVEVRTYGWNIPATLLRIILFPFDAVHHAIKRVV